MNDRDADSTTADVLVRLRDALVDIVGTAATATLLRRAIRGAARHHPELHTLAIEKRGLEYHYALPHTWSRGRDGFPALLAIANELRGLLDDLTGPVVVRTLAVQPGLQHLGLVREEER